MQCFGKPINQLTSQQRDDIDPMQKEKYTEVRVRLLQFDAVAHVGRY